MEGSRKVAILGTESVGKTSILNRFVSDEFDTVVRSTICSAGISKEVQTSDGVVKLELWDTAGQERFRSLSPIYIKGSSAVIFVASCDSPASFSALTSLREMVEASAPSTVKLFAAVNKTDLPVEERVVSDERAIEIIEESLANVPYFFVSAKTGLGIVNLFEKIARDLSQDQLPTTEHNIQLNSPNPQNKTQCC